MNAPQERDEAVAGSVSDLSDPELARRIQEGDRDAFEALARRYMRPVHAVVSGYFRGREDVEDSVQETFLKALEKIHTFDARRPFAPWIYQIARNVARNRRKYAKTRDHEDLTEDQGGSTAASRDDPAESLELAELRTGIAEAIDALPERQRSAFRLHDIEGFTAPEVSEMLGVSSGTVRANVHHARRALRKRLERLRSPR